jgi:REP element-mobilizing transposase RayT
VRCPTYREPVLTDEVADRLDRLAEEKADGLDLDSHRLAIRRDHLRPFTTGDPKLAPNKITRRVEGYVSRWAASRGRRTPSPSTRNDGTIVTV